jgi:hypothetical protein
MHLFRTAIYGTRFLPASMSAQRSPAPGHTFSSVSAPFSASGIAFADVRSRALQRQARFLQRPSRCLVRVRQRPALSSPMSGPSSSGIRPRIRQFLACARRFLATRLQVSDPLSSRPSPLRALDFAIVYICITIYLVEINY